MARFRALNSREKTGWTLLLVLLLLHQPVGAAVIIVDPTCSLADAITAANTDSATGGCTAGAGADELRLTADVTLMEALPAVASEITVEGNDFTVARDDAAPNFRIFEMPGPGPVVLHNLTVSNGRADRGGGIYNDTPLTLLHSTISGNTADDIGGGIYSSWDGPVYLIESTLADNHAANNAGGLYAPFGSSTVIQSSTISGNTAGGHGGGVYNTGYSYMTVTNSTVSGNTAGGKGGGLYNTFYAGDITLLNTTIVGNTAANGGGFYAYPVFASARETPEGDYTEIFLENTVIAANFGGNCAADGQRDLGGNFDDDASCDGAAPIVADVDFDTTLADNGGPTLTHALLEGSVAIDAAGDCGLETDQRGFPRDDGACDSGSVEFSQGGPCVLKIRMGSPVVQSGGTLEFSLFLQHNRPATVTVPFRIWVEDQDGAFIVGRTTPPMTFAQGDRFSRRMTLALPESVGPGPYFVRAEIDQMQQGIVRARGQALVVE